jgi:hypothetical protein
MYSPSYTAGGLWFQVSPGKVSETLSEKQDKNKRAGYGSRGRGPRFNPQVLNKTNKQKNQ